jgi:signal transduction histidine kinase/ActR/RegA family two-component response regulator
MQQNHPQYAESLNRWHFLQSNHGTLGNLTATTNWSSTSLGPIEQWPQSLKTAISIILNTQHPMFIAWGAERIFIYNDAYIQVLSTAKHPWALGRPFAEVWAEIWDTCGPLTEKVFKHAQASFADNVQLFMKRADYLEETYYSFSYSPIRDESGDVMGLFCPSLETTEMMLSERRLKTLGDISAKVLLTKTIKGACELAIATLGENKNDIPFALLYLIDESNKTATLMQSIGLAGGDAAVSPVLVEFENLQANQTIWPISEVIATSTARLLNVTSQTILPLGLAAQQITQAILLPVILTGQDKPIGVLIGGINPCRKLDQTYRTFFDLVIGQVTTAIQNAKACEEEKIRLERLAEVDKAKTLFFSNVSHEFRTPLTLIQGPLEDALADTMHPLPPIQRERLLLMQRNTLRLFKLVNSLLDFSRIEASRMQAIYEPVNITQLTIDLVSVFRSMLEKAGLQLILDIAQIDELVYLDKEMFEKIIFNLLSNAFKFTLQGSITVLLHQQDDKIQLQVKDTGSGIPASELPKMFERFHRIEGSQGRSYEGSGIGLALVAELVKLHGGTIDIESELGYGSTFILKFPLGISHLPEKQLGKRVSHAVGRLGVAYVEEAMHWLPEVPLDPVTPMDIVSSTVTSSELVHKEFINHAKSSVHILLADDNPDMREYVKGLLLSAGWQVNAVTNGEEALHAALANPPDLLLSDVMMPKLDGMQLIAQLRQQPITQLIPMLLLSARAGEESRVEGMTTGADDYLVKPFSAKELLARVKSPFRIRSTTYSA